MHFLAIIISIILIAMFWRLFAGLVLAAVALGLLIGAGVWGWQHVEEYQKRGHWTLTFDIYGDKPVIVNHLASREACEKRRDEIIETTRRARGGRDMWRVSGSCD